MEWKLTSEGRWEPVDDRFELLTLTAEARRLSAQNRERLVESRQLNKRVKERLRAAEARRIFRSCRATAP